MNKTALQCWDRIKRITSTREMGAHYELGNDSYYEVEVRTIEKSLKALEIIKKYIMLIKSCNAHYICLNDESELISKQEFDLLKEVLK